MAGGMHRRGPGEHDDVVTRLGLDRQASTPPAARDHRPSPSGSPEQRRQLPASPSGPRHCWVLDAPECPGRWPGVLLGWEQGGQGWLGRVIVAVEGREGMVAMTLWVRSEHLRPAQVTAPDT